MRKPIKLDDLAQEPVAITGVMLQREGDDLQVLLQIDLQWHLIVSLPPGCQGILVPASGIRDRSDPVEREMYRPGALKARYFRDPGRPRKG